MEYKIYAYNPLGYEGEIVDVEADIRRGIPGFDIVGLPDGAVREARERVRVAVKNSGFRFPYDRILVNLSPGNIKKEGTSFDLALAVAILRASGQILNVNASAIRRCCILGELQLSGSVRKVRGVLPAVTAALSLNIDTVFVPQSNLAEAVSLRRGRIVGITSLKEAVHILERGEPEKFVSHVTHKKEEEPPFDGDFADITGQPVLKRALEIAAAGRHHVFIFGPPGCGKTMAVRRMPSLLTGLSWEQSVEVTKIYSLAGKLPEEQPLIAFPPMRIPHHSATMEGIIGGGFSVKPGEASLAHHGILFLDEAPEFGIHVLQSLREPMEEKKITIVRAGRAFWFPSKFQLIMTANPCPCGNLGREGGICFCSKGELIKYWKRLGSALLDRIDIRVPVKGMTKGNFFSGNEEKSSVIKSRITKAAAIQEERYKNESFSRNSDMEPGSLIRYSGISSGTLSELQEAAEKLKLSFRACHSIIKIARTIADLEGEDILKKDHVYEAVQHRRYGEEDFFWLKR